MYLTKQEIAYKHIKNSIVSGKYKPGSRLILVELEKEINISNMPIREALRRLQSEGWVQSIAHKGVVITEISLKDANENYCIRKALELYSAPEICNNISQKAIEKLKLLHKQMEEYLDNPLQYRELNYCFHFTIFEESRNNTLLRIMRSLWDEGLRFQYTFHFFKERTILSHQEHALFIKALENRDINEFKRITTNHTNRAISYIKELIKKDSNNSPLKSV